MVKRIKIVTVLLIVLIVFASGCALFVVNNSRISDVEKLKMVSSTSESVEINWKKINKADGYRIYVKDEDDKYQLYKEVDEDTVSYNIEKLESAKIIDLRVTAYKIFRDKVYESENAADLTVYTLPAKPEQTAASPDEGLLDIAWKAQKNIVGYELEYSKDKAFDDSNKEVIEDASLKEFKIKDLTPKDVYYARMRSFISVDGEKIYGEWSEVAEVEIAEKLVMGADIDPDKPIVALSFDDGPGFPYGDQENPTKEILDVLEEYGARATFFMCGKRIEKSNVNCLKREIELGCEIGNHTYDHEHYGKNVTAKDISKNSDVIKKKCGKAPSIFRCTGGMLTSTISKECKKEGMPIAYWSVDTEDWKSRDAEDVYKKAMNGVYDGSIILMHDIYPSTAEAVKKIVPALIKEGYQIVTVSEMLTVKNGEAPKPGQQYVDYKTINNNT
ncbi:MAG: polysaccharide deacetylase family protein [Clostridium sp.]|nr:polysaccharide deacetylase family protein [Clostridium sp.]